MYPYADLCELARPPAPAKDFRRDVRDELPLAYLARHGETTWSLGGRYAGRTDLPLTENGERMAIRLGHRLRELEFARVFTTPLQQALRTCELAGFRALAEVDPELAEWNYGEYEGRRVEEIRRLRPGWQLFVDGCPGGESPQEVVQRADRVVARVRSIAGHVLLFTGRNLHHVLTCRWLGLELTDHARLFTVSPASLSVLGYEGSRPVVRTWEEAGERNLAGSMHVTSGR